MRNGCSPGRELSRENRFDELLDYEILERPGMVGNFWSLLKLFFWDEESECFLALDGGGSSLLILRNIFLDLG